CAAGRGDVQQLRLRRHQRDPGVRAGVTRTAVAACGKSPAQAGLFFAEERHSPSPPVCHGSLVMAVDVTTGADADKATDAVSGLVVAGSPPLHSRFRRRAWRALFACLAAVAAVAAAPAFARSPVPDQETLAFVDVHVLPMDRPGVLHNHSVLVD